MLMDYNSIIFRDCTVFVTLLHLVLFNLITSFKKLLPIENTFQNMHQRLIQPDLDSAIRPYDRAPF